MCKSLTRQRFGLNFQVNLSIYLVPIIDEDVSGPPVWRVYGVSPSNSEDDCTLLNWIASLAENFRIDGTKLIDKLLRVSSTDRGPQHFDTRECHHICEATVAKKGGGHRLVKIWQLSGKKVRLHWFYGDDRRLILAHAFLKKDNRIPPSEQARAVGMCQSYFAALAGNQILILNC